MKVEHLIEYLVIIIYTDRSIFPWECTPRLLSVSSALSSTLWLLYCFDFTRLIRLTRHFKNKSLTTPNCTLTCCRYFPGRKLSLRGAARACRAQALPCAAKYYQQLLDLLSAGLGGYKMSESAATTATSSGTTISTTAAADSGIPTDSTNALSPELKLAHEALVFLQAQSSPSRAPSSFPATLRPMSLWHIYTGGNAALDGSDSGSPHLLYALVPLAVMVFGCVWWVWITMQRLRSKVLDHIINSQPGGRGSSLRSRRRANGHDDGGLADHHDDTGDGQATEGVDDREEHPSTGTTGADRRSRRDADRQVLLRNRRSASAW